MIWKQFRRTIPTELDFSSIAAVRKSADSLELSTALERAVPKVEKMLMSRTAPDLLGAIEFFKTGGHLFKIKDTENGMRLMLRLLYISTGQDKKEKGEAVIKAYHSVLFGTDATGR